MTIKMFVKFLMIFFVNVAKYRGGNSIPINEEHPNLLKIKETLTNLQFKPVDEEFVNKHVGRLNVKKATGHNRISSKILKSRQGQ